MKIEEEWAMLRSSNSYGAFSFDGSSEPWDETVHSHFAKAPHARHVHGVYLVRRKDTGEIVYIGKSGTMLQTGSLKKQHLEKRLTNEEDGERRSVVFGRRAKKYGEILIEYVVIDTSVAIPGYFEGKLMQAYFDEHKCLPEYNREF